MRFVMFLTTKGVLLNLGIESLDIGRRWESAPGSVSIEGFTRLTADKDRCETDSLSSAEFSTRF